MNTIKTTNFKWEKVEIPKDLFKQKTSSMLIAWAIWDALWVPVEMKTKEYIEKKYGRLDTYLDSWLNIFFNKWWHAWWKTGCVSDDTILTFTGVESILETWQIEFDDLMKKSSKNYEEFPYGFWWWTTRAISRYNDLEKNDNSKDNYINLWKKNSAWNWVIMKQSPYAAYFLAKQTTEEIINTNIEIITRLTHNHPTAVVASLVHNKFLMELLKTDKDIDLKHLLIFLIEFAKEEETKLKNEITEIEKKENKQIDNISDLLKNLLNDQNNWGLKTYDEILEKYGWGKNIIYSSGYVITTLWIVYSLFLNKQNFESLIDSINIGWDVDTFWAIIWNMIWAYKSKFYTDKYENWVENIDNIQKQTHNFIEEILLENNKKDITRKEYKTKLENWKIEQELLDKNFKKKIKNIVQNWDNIFYNSSWSNESFKLHVPHISIAEHKWYWKLNSKLLKITKDFFLVDFDSKLIKEIKIWEKIKIIKIVELK